MADLKPARFWTVSIDEAGSQFNPNRYEHASEGNRGRLVALLVPSRVDLPELRRHAMEVRVEKADDNAQVVRELAGHGVTVIGLQADVASTVRGSPFASLVLQLLKWVARATPQDEPASLFVRVEERAEHVPGEEWRAIVPALEDVAQLTHGGTSRQRWDLLVVSKDDPDRYARYNGWVDAVAYAWRRAATGCAISREALVETGMLGRDLIDLPGEDVRRLATICDAGGAITNADWDWLLRCDVRPSIVQLAHRVVRKRAAASAELGRRLHQHFVQTTSISPIDLRLAERQERWLVEAGGMALLPDATAHERLAWAKCRLALANHRGHFDQQRITDVEDAARALLDDKPDVAAEALLRVASGCTNVFEYNTARDVLLETIVQRDGSGNLVPDSRLPRLWRGRVLSQLGQLEAFEGRPTEAVALFDRALDEFEAMVDRNVAAPELERTGLYRLVAILDVDPPVDTPEVEETLAGALGEDMNWKSLVEAADVRHRYLHYALTRALVTRPDLWVARARYLASRARWNAGQEHPWELIELHRAVLSPDSASRGRHMRKAHQIACSQGGVATNYIAAVIALMAEAWGFPIAGAKTTLEVDPGLPALQERVRRLDEVAEEVRAGRCGADPWGQIACELLPFNFR